MKWIIIIIAVLVILGIIKAVIDFLAEYGILILAILGCAAVAIGIGYAYIKLGCPNIVFLIIGICLIVANIVGYVNRRNLTKQYTEAYTWAVEKARELIGEKDSINLLIKNGLADTIKKCMAKSGMGTDRELWEKYVKPEYACVDKLNKEIRDYIDDLVYRRARSSDITVIEEAQKPIDLLKRYKEQIPILVQAGDLIVQTKLNGADKKADSWDGNLYKSSKADEEDLGENMLPTEHLYID